MEGKKLINSWLLGNLADTAISLFGLALPNLPEAMPVGGSMINHGNMINYFIVKMGYTAAYVGLYGLASVIPSSKIKYRFVFEKVLPVGSGLVWLAVGLNGLQIAEQLLKTVK